jgi:succinyl-diaminopimelate desuccinylase
LRRAPGPSLEDDRASDDVSADLAERLLWCCRHPSPTGEEATFASAVAARLAATPLAAPVERLGNSIVAELSRGTGGSRVVLFGHLDTVRAQHSAPPRREGDRLYGAGAADMKSGLALMLLLAESSFRPPVDLSLVFYAGEEGPFANNELGRVLAEVPALREADVAVALEPSDNRLELGCGGSVHARVTFRGRSAHSARPWLGDNAIHRGAALLARLAELAPEPREIEGMIWPAVTSATLAQGGSARNLIPDRFELNLNHRFGPDRGVADAERAIVELVGADAEIEFVDRSPPAAPRRDHPLIAAFVPAGVAGIAPKLGYTDVARFAALGVPAVNFGPGTQAQAHRDDEWTSLASLVDGWSILQRWLRRIAGR